MILGAPQTGWVAGALAGYRSPLGEHVGLLVEGRVRYLHLPGFVENRMAPQPGQPVPAPTDFSYVSPGLHVGFTYRF